MRNLLLVELPVEPVTSLLRRNQLLAEALVEQEISLLRSPLLVEALVEQGTSLPRSLLLAEVLAEQVRSK